MKGNFYFKHVENHPLEGKYADFDWRQEKERGMPYDLLNKNVTQNVFVEWVGENCYGELFAFSKSHLHQSVKRVCNVRG